MRPSIHYRGGIEDLSKLIDELDTAAKSFGFNSSEFGQINAWPLVALTRWTDSVDAKNIYISAGLHGDEPAGPLAILELLQEGLLPEKHNYWICPILNPIGLEHGSRENAEGIDLNRDYEALRSPEIQAHVKWANAELQHIDVGLHLHEDWESTGFYFYEEDADKDSSYAAGILDAVRAHMPIDESEEIDGWPAQNGLIQVSDLPQDQVGTAESGFFNRHFGSQNYTLESASALPIDARVAALKAAVLSVVA